MLKRIVMCVLITVLFICSTTMAIADSQATGSTAKINEVIEAKIMGNILGMPAYVNRIPIFVNNSEVQFPDLLPYTAADGNIIVPARYVALKLGAEVTWDAAKNAAVFSLNGNSIEVKAVYKYSTSFTRTNGKKIEAVVKNGRIFLPADYIAEVLGATSKYDKVNKRVGIQIDPSIYTSGGIGIKITEENNNTAIEVEKGQFIVIALNSNPSTGYGWEFDKRLDGAALSLMNSFYVAPPAKDPPIVGAGGTQFYVFKAEVAGTASIDLKYDRSWADDSTVATFKADITVK